MEEESDKHWELESWLKLMVSRSLTIEAAPIERLLIEMSLRYLHAESKTSRARRDHDGIKRVWQTIHPYLDKNRMLTQFKADKVLKSRLQFFVKGGFGI